MHYVPFPDTSVQVPSLAFHTQILPSASAEYKVSPAATIEAICLLCPYKPYRDEERRKNMDNI